MSPPAADDAAPAPPIIDEVTVEKTEVCEGEENLVTVKAHTPAGRDDAFLHYFIGAKPGRSVPVRAYLPPAGGATPGPMHAQAFGRDNVVTSVPIPHYVIKRCRPDRMLYLTARQMPNSLDEFEIEAVVRESGASPPLRVTAFRWSFGDRASEVTAHPAVVHRYAPSDPDALYSEYLVTCEAVGSDGRTVIGRTALSLRNTEFENLHYNKALVLSVELTPRFPQLDARGQVAQSVRLYHHRSAPVRLERARVTYFAARDGAVQPPEEPSVVEVLGTNDVLPGRGVERVFRFDAVAHPNAAMVDYDLEGHTADGVRAFAHFSLMRPPAPPTADTGDPVSDPLLTQKIVLARERLGKAFVNDEDLRQLEHDGAFANLEPSPAAPALDDTAAPPPSVRAGLASKSAAARR